MNLIRFLPLLAAIALSSACKSLDDAKSHAGNRATAVIADISPGTNPYHEVFRRPGWTHHPCTVIPGFPCDAPALRLTLGRDYERSLARDAGVWARYQRDTVYWVPNTNLLLLTLRSWEHIADIDIQDGYGGADVYHGLGTAAAASNACPACYVLVVQDSASIDGLPIRRIAEQYPWVDFVVSTNLAEYGGFEEHHIEGAYAEASKALADSGRLFFAAAGNLGSIVPPAIHQYHLPPWIVTVGGAIGPNPRRFFFPETAVPECNGVPPVSGRVMDFAGQFTQVVPEVLTVDGYTMFAGTSFSAPQVAGSFGRMLIEIRRVLGDRRAPGVLWQGRAGALPFLADGQLVSEELRAAAAFAARYFATEEFNATCVHEYAFTSAPRPVAPTPWVDMGWGFFAEGEAHFAAQVILGRSELPEKPLPALAHMAALAAAREAAFP